MPHLLREGGTFGIDRTKNIKEAYMRSQVQYR
jgi:hypothetical protein